MNPQASAAGEAGPLLGPGDPAPVEVENPGSEAPVLFICDHAGQAVPAQLGGLGLAPEDLSRHIAWDIGAEKVASDLAARFGARLVKQRYSRLVIDCNRPPGTPTSMPPVGDGIAVPGNQGLEPAARAAREAEIFAPFAARCRAEIARPGLRFAFAIHSFTPVLGQERRPWDVGFLYRHPASRGDDLAALAERQMPGRLVGRNRPYRIEDETDWFIPACAEPRGIPHCLIEIRNDHLSTDEGAATWAAALHDLLSAFMELCDGADP